MQAFLFSNAYVALCGAALTAASFVLLGAAPRLSGPAGLVFFATMVVYNLDRLVEPRPGDSVHERWVERHRRVLWAVTILCAGGALATAVMLPRGVWPTLSIAGLVAIGYCVPLVRWQGRWRRLKELPGAKLVLIAGVWTYATAGLPMLVADHLPSVPMLVAILVARVLFLAAVALPFDMPDAGRDRQAGIITIPTALGDSATRRIAVALALGSATAALLNPWPQAAALLVSLAVTAGLLLAMRAGRGVLYYSFALDGLLLVQAGLLAAAGA